MAANKVFDAQVGGINGGTTAAVDSTTAKTLVLAATYASTATITISDSVGLTWTAGTERTQGSMKMRMYYAQNPTGSASHTVTVSGTGSASAITVSGYSGSYTGGDPLQAQQGGAATGATVAGVGSADLVPTTADNFIVAAVSHSAAITGFAAQAGFASAGQIAFAGGSNFGVGAVWKAQSAATTIPNSTVVSQWTTAVDVCVASMAFRAESAGPTVPGAPTIGTASAGNAAASTTFTAPASDGGSAITSYTTTAYRVSDNVSVGSVTGAGSPATVTGLTNGVAVYLKTKATNAVGTGPESAASNSVTPAAGGALAAGTASLSSATVTTLNVTCTAASGGTVPLTYQWHRSITANFTPGGGTVVSGATSLTLADSTGLSQGVPYYYKLRVTDSLAETADSNQIAGSLRLPDLNLGGLGDSITNQFGLSAGQGPLEQAAVQLRVMGGYRNVNVVNRGINGASTADWLSGSSNLNNAKTAFAAGSVTHVHIMLGANDAAAVNLRSAAAYKANLQNIITDLLGSGYKVILSYPTYIPAGANSNATTAASVALAQAYQAEIDSLINNTTILRGDTNSFNAFMDNLVAWYQSDMTHPNVGGAQSLGSMWSRAMQKAIYENDSPALTTRNVSFSLVQDDVNPAAPKVPAASLTGVRVSFYDEASPDLLGVPRYQSAAETTDGSGVLAFSVGSTLASGGTGYIVVDLADGRHYNAPVQVT